MNLQLLPPQPIILLLLASFMAVAQQSFAQQQYVMQLGAPPADQGSRSLVTAEAQLRELPLVELQGCMVGDGATYKLPPGLLDTCNVFLNNLHPHQPQLLMFEVGDNVEMTVSIVLKVEGGSARMDLWHPGAPADQAPSQSSHDLAVSQASAESFLTIAPDTLLATPGQYVLRVEVISGTPVNGWLRVDTPGRDLQLNKFDHSIMVQMAQSCCQGNPADSPFCSVIAPRSLYQTHSWTRDLCHFGPSSCNAAGQLTRLILPDLGLNCPVFPAMLGKLPALRRLDLSQNVLGKSVIDQVAEALLGASDLVEVALASTGLSGELSCLFLDLKNLKVLDLSFNFIEGPIPGCLLNALTELYLTGNDLSGTLAGWHSGSQLTTFFANAQRGQGLLGSFPGSFVLLRNLQYLNLAGNSLAGQLPGLPPNLRLFNISDNSINGQIGALPLSMWVYDARNNRLTGGLPLLSMFDDLEVFAASDNQLQGGIMALGASLRQLELANCGLSGPLPVLPASLKRLDLSENAFSGDIAFWDGSSVEMLRLANNRLAGPLPAFVSTSSSLILLDLHGNRLSGPLPATWTSANLQMMMLENNTLTGTLPPSLAALPNLVVLRLAGNKLNGSLSEFVSVLPRPANLTADTAGAATSKMFDLDLSWNQLSGTVPESIAALGLFNPYVTILLPSAGQSIVQVPRRLDLSGNKLTGPWPTWLLTEVPALIVRCSCLVSVRLAGAGVSQLECPEQEISLTDYQWQVALEQRYNCWDGHTQQLMMDYLSSPAHSLQAPGPSSISTTTNTRILSDRDSDASGINGAAGSNLQPDRSSILGQWAEPSGHDGSDGTTQKKGKAGPGGGVIAGAVIGSILGAALLGLAAYYLVYDHMLRQYKKDIFHKFQDDPTAAASLANAALLQGSALQSHQHAPSTSSNSRHSSSSSSRKSHHQSCKHHQGSGSTSCSRCKSTSKQDKGSSSSKREGSSSRRHDSAVDNLRMLHVLEDDRQGRGQGSQPL